MRLIVVVFSAALALAAPVVTLTNQTVQLPPRDPTPPPPQQPGRGQGAPQPTVRYVPVGSAAITGTVTTADSGRPIRGARVSLNGSLPVSAARGIGAAGAIGGSSGVIGGVSGVVAGGSGRGGVVITQGPAGVSMGISMGVSRTAVTDAQGQFAFGKLPAGSYTLNASRNQYLSTSYGQKKAGGQGTTITLVDGQTMKTNLPLMRGGVITGLVIGEDGEPQPNIQIRASRYAMQNGLRRLQQNGSANTDDRGVYRLFGLQPGDYVVSATPNGADVMMSDRMMADMAAMEQAIASGAVQPPAGPGLPATVAVPIQPQPSGPVASQQPPGYLPTYSPNAAVPTDAAIVHVAGGDEHPNVDIQVRLVQASTIQGTVTGAPGPGVAVQITLLNDDPGAEANMPGARVGPDGTFTLRTIAPGKYTVYAQTMASPPPMTIVDGVPNRQTGPPPALTDDQKLWGRVPITVEGTSTMTVNVPLHPSRTIAGTVVFDMAKPPDLTRSRVMVTLSPAPAAQQTFMSGGTPQAPVGADGHFTMTGVSPGKYILRASGGGGTLKSATVGGQDTLDVPLDFAGDHDVTDAVITLADTYTEVTGMLTDPTGKPALDYTIVVASTDERYWTPGSRRIVATRPNNEGRYTLRNLPPGSYLLAAVTDLEGGGQYDPELLKSIRRASMTVTLGEGTKLTQDLRVGR